ncbi:MAG: bifunctional UDP-N-acetylglucosamine diphosphorylase/glucosamine-1-phosphate N-acetyltransferase GlmU [Gallionellaceae bacterium]|jgi:bifunctional UDP-N-acetylglucosamine pyrophosphorylase/glucosamine-1-phosphate N-acetyltransferase
MTNLNIVILAAGKGTRMYSDTPKVLHNLAGKSLVQHVLDTASELHSNNTIIIFGHGGEAVPKALSHSNSHFVLQEPQLGTGHAVRQAIPKLLPDSRTLILYGDVPLIQTSTLQKMLEVESDLILLTIMLDNPSGYGRILRDAQGEVQEIVEEKDATAEQRLIKEVNTGMLLAKTNFLEKWLSSLTNANVQGEYYLTDIVSLAVKDSVSVKTVHPAHQWEVEGINSKIQLANLERTWQSVLAMRLLAQGVTLADPARIDIRGQLNCERDVEIDVGCIFEGNVTLGKGVKVGAHSIVKNTFVSANTEIAPYSHIDQATLGDNCRIGPFARIRPGSQLSNDVHVGNFVEIKNSNIASYSKANHLSYIGDATIGSRVNIGAGTITCNYDGANKFRTTIEDDAFIGSDTQLVAPVTVRKGATIGAGSTITRDTPANELSLSRSKQISVPSWQRPTKKK